MKKNLPVTEKEVILSEDDEIISTTDLKGRITSINKTFLEVSGFEEDELIGKAHNIVRHPDMPSAAFANMWEDLKAGKAWSGIVKNRCKNGDYYWVDAFVTPTYQNGSVSGYESVRVLANKDTRQRAEKLYQSINQGKQPRLNNSLSAFTNYLSITSLLLCGLAGIYFGAPAFVMLGFVLIGSILSLYSLQKTQTDLKTASNESRHMADNKLMQYVFTGRSDEIGQLQFANHMMQARLRTVLGRVIEASKKVEISASDMMGSVSKTHEIVNQQKTETEMVATAMEEMTYSVQEVSQHATETAKTATEANDGVIAGQSELSATVKAIHQLTDSMKTSGDSIKRLEAESENIRKVLDVIGGIADQTNLLALNAAIEAARAGEQGRGFAVVADEVRSLAQRTQESTFEIQEMVEVLENCSRQSVKEMQIGLEQTDATISQAETTNIQLGSVANLIQKINQMNHNIAIAVEQQSEVTSEINKNIHSINSLGESTAVQSEQAYQLSKDLSDNSFEMHNMITRFKV